MKILIIRNYPSYMNVINNTYNIQEVGLAKALVRRGNCCDIIFWTNKEEKEVEIPVEDKGKVTVFYRQGKTVLKNTVFMGCDELFSKYDILQPCEYNQIQSWILAQKYPEKVIIYHGPYYSAFNKRYNLMCKVFDKIFLKDYIKQDTKFIVKSNLAKDFLLKKGIKSKHISVVGVGIDAQMLSTKDDKCKNSLYERMLLDGDNPKILYVGRFEERRNIAFILNVFAKVVNQLPKAKLYMIGDGDNEYMSMIWSLAKKLKIDDKIEYQKTIEQKYLSKIYEKSNIFLLPTEYEIFGMVLLEAMYYENVVITTINGGSDMLIKDGKNGYVLEKIDTSEWRQLIVKSIKDKQQTKLIGRKARLTISENYTWDELAEKFEEQYSEVVIRGYIK